MIVNTDCDVCICCCWTVTGGGINHRISGHMFEMIEYHYILSTKYNVKMLFGDPKLTPEILRSIITDKYTFTLSERERILQNTIFVTEPPKYVLGKTALFVDGCIYRMEPEGVKLVFDNIYSFKCSSVEHLHDLKGHNVIPLLDKRVYCDVNPEDTNIGIDYRKKMLLSKLKKSVKSPNVTTGMLYLTKNCRSLELKDVIKICERFDFQQYIIVTDTDDYSSLESDIITIMKAPVHDLFDKFTGYIYTPLNGVWDGSPRLPVECKINNKQFLTYKIGDDYLSRDRGLFYRLKDIDENIDQLELKLDDRILDIL